MNHAYSFGMTFEISGVHLYTLKNEPEAAHIVPFAGESHAELNLGIVFDAEHMDKLAQMWLAERGLL